MTHPPAGPSTPTPPPGPRDRLLAAIVSAMHGLLAATALVVLCAPTYWSYS